MLKLPLLLSQFLEHASDFRTTRPPAKWPPFPVIVMPRVRWDSSAWAPHLSTPESKPPLLLEHIFFAEELLRQGSSYELDAGSGMVKNTFPPVWFPTSLLMTPMLPSIVVRKVRKRPSFLSQVLDESFFPLMPQTTEISPYIFFRALTSVSMGLPDSRIRG